MKLLRFFRSCAAARDLFVHLHNIIIATLVCISLSCVHNLLSVRQILIDLARDPQTIVCFPVCDFIELNSIEWTHHDRARVREDHWELVSDRGSKQLTEEYRPVAVVVDVALAGWIMGGHKIIMAIIFI